MGIEHLSDEDLVLHYYGDREAAGDADASAHLASCTACRSEYARLQHVLRLVDEGAAAPIQVPPSFERTVWARLEPKLRRERRGWTGWLLWPAPALAAAVAVLVVGAFLAGRALSPSRPSDPPAAALAVEQMREQILLADVGDHLDQSQMVLVELVSSGDNGIDMSGERARAEQLVADNRLYRQTALDTGDAVLSELLDEIERVLTEIAASPERMSARDLTDVRRRVESRDLLFKLRVVSSQVRERQKEALQRRAIPQS